MDPVRAIADAVLYEGYVLWPYRKSALKNQRRWTFGGVYPRGWSAEHPDDASLMRTELLVEGGPHTAVEVGVRFLHVVRRESGEGFVDWDEATERELGARVLLGEAWSVPLRVDAGSEEARSWEGLEGMVEVGSEEVAGGVFRLTVTIANTTPCAGLPREEVLRRTFCSAHTVLRAGGGSFVSCTDPPDGLRAQVEACSNVGTWPVLVVERHTVLSSPIILEDHPRIAPESPGDLFDGGEVDQLLTLSILAMTDEEKAEMRAADPRTREILERTEALTPEQLMALHGTMRR